MAVKRAVFPGSFDPFTLGHQDIVLRGAELFDEVVVAIGTNTSKKRYFPIDYMIQKIEETFHGVPNVRIDSFEGLTAKYAEKIDADYILRGLRNTTDFEYENTIAQANKHTFENLETVFLITSPELAYISSTIVRELHKFNGDVSKFLPYSL
jgi:pantetheine-phosphate adenylyltransferase